MFEDGPQQWVSHHRCLCPDRRPPREKGPRGVEPVEEMLLLKRALASGFLNLEVFLDLQREERSCAILVRMR